METGLPKKPRGTNRNRSVLMCRTPYAPSHTLLRLCPRAQFSIKRLKKKKKNTIEGSTFLDIISPLN